VAQAGVSGWGVARATGTAALTVGPWRNLTVENLFRLGSSAPNFEKWSILNSRIGQQFGREKNITHKRTEVVDGREFGTAACPQQGAQEMPSRLVDDPEHWRDRATEMRDLLDAITDLDMKSKVLRLADDYDTLAERAEDRAGGVKNYSPK
jgi:hypothetical protein